MQIMRRQSAASAGCLRSLSQRTGLIIWSGAWNAALTSTMHTYIKSIQVWTCADWKRGSTGPNPNCFGPILVTNADGSQTYTVTTQ
jgi:hypothetical protein